MDQSYLGCCVPIQPRFRMGRTVSPSRVSSTGSYIRAARRSTREHHIALAAAVTDYAEPIDLSEKLNCILVVQRAFSRYKKAFLNNIAMAIGSHKLPLDPERLSSVCEPQIPLYFAR